MKHLNYLQARDFMGSPIDEELPPRLVLTGPNGCGKTKRLLAVRLGLLGPEGNAGLAPWATGPNPSVSVTAPGLVVSRISALTKSPDGGVTVKTKTDLAPSLGEKTKAAVAIRIERDLAPNVLALELEALFGKSAKERRRSFLEALGGSATYSARQAFEELDEALADNCTWTAVMAGELGPMKAAAPDGLALLSMVEAAAKAKAGDARQKKRTAEALLKAEIAAPEGNLEEMEKRRDELSKEILDLVAAQAAAGERVRRITQIQAERALLLNVYPACSQVEYDREGFALSIEDFSAELSSADDEEDAKAILERRRAKLVRFSEKAAGWLEDRTNDVTDADNALEVASAQASHDAGYLSALEILLEECMGGLCPICSSEITVEDNEADDVPEREAAAKARVSYDAALKAEGEARVAANDARGEHRIAHAFNAQAVTMLRDEDKAAKARTSVLEIDAELLKIREDAKPFDEATLAAARDRKDRIEEQISEILKAQGAAAEREKVERALETAEMDRKDAEEVQNQAGPKGLAGKALEALVGGVMGRAASVFSSAYPDRKLTLRLEDERGNPDAFLAVTRDGKTFAGWGTASGGEKAVAAAALVVALSELDPSRLSVALIEAGEIDGNGLRKLLVALTEGETPALANVIVATHRNPLDLPGTITAPGLFDILDLGEAVAS